MTYEFRKMELKAALQIIGWNYAPPYHVYNLNGSALALARLVDGSYFSVIFEQKLIGFFCYGEAAQLNSKKDNVIYHQEGYLDIGLGMNPTWCNRGKGVEFVGAGMRYARDLGWHAGFRLTVASNNLRAHKVYTRLGFQEIGRIAWNSSLSSDFIIMTLDNLEPISLVSWAD